MNRIHLTRYFLFVLIAALLIPIAPTQAQGGLSDEERELLGVIQNSVTTFYEQQSYVYEVEQLTSSDMEMMGQSMTSSVTQLIAGETINSPDNPASHLTFETTTETTMAGMPAGSLAQVLGYEIIKIGDATYMRFTSVDETMSMMSGMGGFSFPEEWTLVDDAASASNPMLTAYSATSDFALAYLPLVGFNEENFNSVVELESEEIDGQAMRVIELSWNPEAVASGTLLGVNTAIANQAAGALGGVTGGAPAPTTEEVDPELLQSIFEGATFTQKVWIGADDGLPHRVELTTTIDTEISASGFSLPILQETVTTVTFTAFNTALTIEAPIEE